MGGWQRRNFVTAGMAGMGSLLGAACQRSAAPQTHPHDSETKMGAPDSESTALPRRPFGTTGETVSALGLGGYHLGLPSAEEATRIMHRAIDAGMTFFDNCWSYHTGESERRMGEALLGGKRDKVFLMTKIDARTRDAATEQLEACLRRLRTDRIDLVQIHEVGQARDAAWVFSDDGAVRALEDARRAGKVRLLGFTGHKSPAVHLAMLEEAERNGFRFDAVQMPLNVMDAHYESFQREVLPKAVAAGIAVIGMKALGSGSIVESGLVTAEECLRFALSSPAATVVTGCDSLEILDQALRVGRSFRPLADEERQELLARTAEAAAEGRYERFKTTQEFDSLARNPHWMTGGDF